MCQKICFMMFYIPHGNICIYILKCFYLFGVFSESYILYENIIVYCSSKTIVGILDLYQLKSYQTKIYVKRIKTKLSKIWNA